MKLRAPFPAFGGKSRVAAVVWRRLGDVANYIEPFANSAAVLLLRPHPGRIETVNDLDCYIANFWRATATCPEEVAEWADWPVNEADLHARHRWLVLSPYAAEFRRRMRSEPGYFDARVAGLWCWGLCCWIGSGWCDASRLERHLETVWEKRPHLSNQDGNGQGVFRNGPAGGSGNRSVLLGGGDGQFGHGVHAKGQLPDLSGDAGASGRGIHASGKRPLLGGRSERDNGHGVHRINDGNRPQLADAYSRGRGIHGNDDAGNCAQRRAWLLEWFSKLRDRLRTVRVCCGDWLRVCDSESVTTRLGTTAIFFDPPYSAKAGRDMSIYSTDCGQVAHKVRAYCLERGQHPLMRIALCGYAGEGHEELERHGWDCFAWQASGGYGSRSEKGKANAKKERIWFSPHCIQPERQLFA